MARGTIIALISTAICLALAACTATSQGQPVPPGTTTSESTPMTTSTPSAPQSSSPSSGDLPSDGAPKVNNSLDASRYQQNPCQMLTPAQLQQLNLPRPGVQRQGPLGLECSWQNKETFASVVLGWADKNPRGLSGTYAARNAGRYAYFIELGEIEGFPAVAASLGDGRDIGLCGVDVGVSDRLVLGVSVQLSRANVGKKDPCEDGVVQVVAMMLQTMKAGN